MHKAYRNILQQQNYLFLLTATNREFYVLYLLYFGLEESICEKVGFVGCVPFSLYAFRFSAFSESDYTVDHASFPPDLPGDVNYDGKVDVKDVGIVSKAFGSYFLY